MSLVRTTHGALWSRGRLPGAGLLACAILPAAVLLLAGCGDDTCEQVEECAIALLAPNGGERWTQGDSVTVAWTAEDACGDLARLDLLHDGDSCWVIADSVGLSGGTCNWIAAACAADSAGYTVRITDLGSGREDTSDSSFVIRTPPSCTLTLTAPNGGEYWVPGAPVTITWDSALCSDSVSLQLLRAATPCLTIAAAVANTGRYDWTAARCGSAAAGYTIRVTDPDSGTQDESDAPFEITTEIPLSYALAQAGPGEANGHAFAHLCDLDPALRYVGGAVITEDTCLRGHGAWIDLDGEHIRVELAGAATRCDVEYCIIINGDTDDPFGGALRYRPLCYGWVYNNTFFRNRISGIYLDEGVPAGDPHMRIFNNIFCEDAICGVVRNDNHPDGFVRYNCSNAHNGDRNFCDHCGCPDSPTPDPLQPSEMGPGNQTADPSFVRKEKLPWDLHLKADSPCIAAGENGEDLGALPFQRQAD
ncbi:MAG: hypothetical protein FJ313_04490 [Gemmatimonadetes bacterium]|nr:hypothetical protein [Gemmatimonadota bacterium]